MSEDQKYKLFRNYMANELGITKEDIRAWTQAAIEREIERIVGQLNIHGMAQKAVKAALIEWGTKSFGHTVSSALGAEIAKRLVITVGSSESENGNLTGE